MENDNYEIHVLSKVVPTIETVVLNMLPSCQDDLCPLRPQLYTSWTGGILAGKIPLRRDKCLAKVVPTGCQKNWFAFKSPANGPQTKVGLFSNPLFQPFRWGFWLWRRSPTSPNVCLSVCVWSIWKYAFLHPSTISRMHAECSWMVQNECRMFQNIPECMQNVPEYMQNGPECMQKGPERMPIHELACRSKH